MRSLLLWLMFVAGVFTTLAKPPPPPNFVIIFADDMGYGDAGCFGSKDIRTPRIDRMAKEGMRFTSFYAQPICGPSRAALMTGCQPLRVAEVGNIKNVHPELHDKEITIAEVLKTKGYATACFGKWDLARHSQLKFNPKLMPNHQGFDYFFGTPTSNDGFVDLYRNGKRIEEKADMNLLTQRYTDEVIGFIKANQSKPFFVYLPHTMPHTRLGASNKFKGKSPRGLYGDVIEEIDHSTGQILDALGELGLEKNTYVLFTSDNGPWLIKNQGKIDGTLEGDHGGSAGILRSGKVSTWEGGQRVPAVFWAPGRIRPNTTCKTMASTLDILPTFTTLAGAKTPKNRDLDGEDISRLLAGRFDEARMEKVYYYYLRTTLQAVRQGKWKLHLPRPAKRPWLAPFAQNKHIHPKDDAAFGEPLLYDLEGDVSETTNVAQANPKVVKQLLAIAEKARTEIGDYNRIGSGARFFDEGVHRPDVKKWIQQK
ncbi:MAG: sulfatase [Verrucomicrobiota bacterium]|nr:sulfatase [Verrucomicrobiota bacterium]